MEATYSNTTAQNYSVTSEDIELVLWNSFTLGILWRQIMRGTVCHMQLSCG